MKEFRFTGDVYALPEGSIFFKNEPILEITAPVIESQIVETFVLNAIGFQTLVATKAARCVYAAQGRPLIDFSLRRTQGIDPGVKVARNSFIAGFFRHQQRPGRKNLPYPGFRHHGPLLCSGL